MHDAFRASLLDPDQAVPEGLTSWNGSSTQQRFAIYRNTVASSLTEALARTFPAVRAIVGETFFSAMAGVFARAYPPTSPILARFGAGFADFLDTFPPVAELPYLPDVARLEFAMLEAFHAGDAIPATLAALTAVAPDELAALRFGVHPAARMVRSRYAVSTLVALNRDGGDFDAIDADRPENALVVRPDLAVSVLAVDAAVAALFGAIARGETLGVAAAAAAGLAENGEIGPVLARAFSAGAFIGPISL